MMEDDFTLKNPRDTLYLYNISDLHLGSASCNLKYIKHMFKEMKDLKGEIIINILGDLFECASIRVGNSAFRQIWTVNEQVREAHKLFRSVAKRSNIHIRKAVPGNHDIRLRKEDFDLMEEFCDRLSIDYCANTNISIAKRKGETEFLKKANFVDKIWVNGKPIKIFGRHGLGSAKRLDLAMSKQDRETIRKDADIYVEGHNHRCHYYPQTMQTSVDEGGFKWQHYGFTGHFLSYPGGYAEEAGLDILPEAYLRMTINDINDKIFIDGKEFFVDRYRPDLFKILIVTKLCSVYSMRRNKMNPKEVNKYIVKDAFGREIQLHDTVAHIYGDMGSMELGIVESFTPKSIRLITVKQIRNWNTREIETSFSHTITNAPNRLCIIKDTGMPDIDKALKDLL
ncbi:MAG: metallophosphoesterase [Methanobacterium paludis]|nr:metallophosphoesterase [Methanobacterium paludis]